MHTFKYFLFAITFISCTRDVVNFAYANEPQDTISSIKNQILQHIDHPKSTWNQIAVAKPKSLEDKTDQIIYTASFDQFTCEARLTSDPDIDAFFIDQYVVFFTNVHNLNNITDLKYEDVFQVPILIQDPEVYQFDIEDYTAFVIDVQSTADCPLNVTATLWTD